MSTTYTMPRWALPIIDKIDVGLGARLLQDRDDSDSNTMKLRASNMNSRDDDLIENALMVSRIPFEKRSSSVANSECKWVHFDNDHIDAHISVESDIYSLDAKAINNMLKEDDIETVRKYFSEYEKKHLAHNDFNLHETLASSWHQLVLATLSNEGFPLPEEDEDKELIARCISNGYLFQLMQVAKINDFAEVKNIIVTAGQFVDEPGEIRVSYARKQMGWGTAMLDHFHYTRSTMMEVAPLLWKEDSTLRLHSQIISDMDNMKPLEQFEMIKSIALYDHIPVDRKNLEGLVEITSGNSHSQGTSYEHRFKSDLLKVKSQSISPTVSAQQPKRLGL